MKRSGFASRSIVANRQPAEKARNAWIKQMLDNKIISNPPVSRPRAVMGGSTTGPRPKEAVKAKPGKRAPTVAERAWMDWIVAQGCIACRLDGNGFVRAEVHHILRGGQRMGHWYTLPLCPGHHRHDSASGKIPRHPYKARFEERYGSEDDLLAVLSAIYYEEKK